MFHRVKSEGEGQQRDSVVQDNAKVELKPQKENETNSIDNSKEIEKTSSEDFALEETDQKQTETASNSKTEDNATMNDQDKTQNEEAAPAAAAPYQRPGQPAMRSAGGYPGAYPGMSSTSDMSDSDRRLTIGAGITMSGEIESCDYLLVEGTVEAALKGANMLEIAESGTFYGTVEIVDANISGRFEGDITVSGRLTISSTGIVTGSISYKEIEIEAGAVLDGKLTPMNAVPESTAKKPTAAKAAKPAAKPAKAEEKQPEPANSDGGLFSKAAAAAE